MSAAGRSSTSKGHRFKPPVLLPVRPRRTSPVSPAIVELIGESVPRVHPMFPWPSEAAVSLFSRSRRAVSLGVDLAARALLRAELRPNGRSGEDGGHSAGFASSRRFICHAERPRRARIDRGSPLQSFVWYDVPGKKRARTGRRVPEGGKLLLPNTALSLRQYTDPTQQPDKAQRKVRYPSDATLQG